MVALSLLPVCQATGDEPQWSVKHPPYLQLGNAPLPGLPGSDKDQVEIVWQTVPAGSGTADRFMVEFRPVAEGIETTWQAAEPVQTLETKSKGRTIHSAVIKGLEYHARYEYRVRHLRGDAEQAVYQHAFRTRLPAGDATPFWFATYGDSAGEGSLPNFLAVQRRINEMDPPFTVLLGDNVYESGSHDEFDVRLDPLVNPDTPAYMATHLEHYAMGNHDFGTARGQPSLDNYSVPIPALGTTSTVVPPAGERPELNYSFDYGQVHFTTFDSNSWLAASRLAKQLDWVVADVTASKAHWKIVFAHHPVASLVDHGEHRPGTNYYRQVVKRLREAQVDLFLVGHAHCYQRSFPLLGEEGGRATFVHDTDDTYQRRDGLVQVIAGMGGRSLRDGKVPMNLHVAKSFMADSDPPSRYGFLKVAVTPEALDCEYVAADDGSLLDRFRVVAE